jgi:Leucine-rich repeat (LRR) protein
MGLEGHRHLRVLFATHNNISGPPARIAALLDSIPNLEVVCLRENPCMRNAEDRTKLLGILHSQRVFAPVLHTLDTPITLGERVDAWKRAEPSESADNGAERLRYSVVLHLFFLQQPDPHIQHNLLTVLDLSYSELCFVDVVEFENLRELVLAGNRLESLEHTNIEKLHLLEVLDLRFNLLPKLESIAAVVSQLPLLETVGILGNKCAQSGAAAVLSTITLRDMRSFRVRFLALLPDALRVRGHPLNVIDSKEITMEERAQACKSETSSELLSASLPNLPDPTTERRSTLAGTYPIFFSTNFNILQALN